MLTTDPIYKKPLLPVITIKNTANTSTLYTYSSFTGTATVITTAFPLYCSVSLSQNTHGEFTIQFDDPNQAMASTVTVGSRVIIECGKQSSSITRLISGLVRKKGYARGANNKIIYTISGSSTGIRLNERITYQVTEAAKTLTGEPDITDASRKADTLLEFNLGVLPADGILSITNLATNSDVETFIPSLAIEYGEVQDAVNYIEDQSGGEVFIDTNDLVNFRYEIKNTFFGRGFTLKNTFAGAANDDADDTMYLRGKSWSYDDDFYKSANYANKLVGILSPDNRPSTKLDLGFTSAFLSYGVTAPTVEYAYKFRPTHTHWVPGDLYVVGGPFATSGTLEPINQRFRICNDSGGVPANSGGVNFTVLFTKEQFSGPVPIPVPTDGSYELRNEQIFLSNSLGDTRIDSYNLDTSFDYWLICSNQGISGNYRFGWGRDSVGTTALGMSKTHSSTFSTNTDGGANWVDDIGGNKAAFEVGRYRSHSFVTYDPKAMQAVSSGLTAGQVVETVLSDISPQIRTRQSMYRHLSNQLYNTVRPRTVYNFPSVLAPNIPPLPGDPIVIDDTILGFSEPGNQVVLTICGDMTYQWGNMGSGNYEAPTILNIQAIGVHPRYR